MSLNQLESHHPPAGILLGRLYRCGVTDFTFHRISKYMQVTDQNSYTLPAPLTERVVSHLTIFASFGFFLLFPQLLLLDTKRCVGLRTEA
jgi:hypothetical protein